MHLQRKQKGVVVSLAPADIKKEGSRFDLPIAIAYLLAAGQVDFDTDGKVFLGELSLDGNIYPVKGVLPSVIHARNSGMKEVFVPKDNAKEAGLVEGIKIYPVGNLTEVLTHFSGEVIIEPTAKNRA